MILRDVVVMIWIYEDTSGWNHEGLVLYGETWGLNQDTLGLNDETWSFNHEIHALMSGQLFIDHGFSQWTVFSPAHEMKIVSLGIIQGGAPVP